MQYLRNGSGRNLGKGKALACLIASVAMAGCGSDSAPTVSQISAPASESSSSVSAVLLPGDPRFELSLRPTRVCPGDELTISGADLSSPELVIFNGPLVGGTPVEEDEFIYQDFPIRERILVDVPASAESGSVTVVLGSNSLTSRQRLTIEDPDSLFCNPPTPRPSPTPPQIPNFVSSPEPESTINFSLNPSNPLPVTQEIMLGNDGTALLTIDGVSLSGEGAEFFNITEFGPGSVQPGTEPGENGSVTVQCVGTGDASSEVEAVLTIQTNDPLPPAQGGEFTYDLSCGFDGVPSYDSVPPPGSDIHFGVVPIGSEELLVETIVVSEDGRADLVVMMPEFETGMGSDRRSFVFDPDGNFETFPQTIVDDSGNTLEFEFACDPDSRDLPQTYFGPVDLMTTVEIGSNDPVFSTPNAPATYGLTCTATDPNPVGPLDDTIVIQSPQSSQTVVIRNSQLDGPNGAPLSEPNIPLELTRIELQNDNGNVGSIFFQGNGTSLTPPTVTLNNNEQFPFELECTNSGDSATLIIETNSELTPQLQYTVQCGGRGRPPQPPPNGGLG